MSVLNGTNDGGGDDCANIFEFMTPLQPSDLYFSTTDLTTPTFADAATNSDAINSRPPAVPEHQSSLERVEEEKTAPGPCKRKHSDVEKDRRRSISNGFTVLQSILHNDPNAKPISKSILLQQACDEIRELRKKLEASTAIITRFGLENLFQPTPLGQQPSPPVPTSRSYSPHANSLCPETFADSRRASTSTSTTGTLYNVSFSDHPKEEKRKPYNKHMDSYGSTSEGSDDDSINTASSISGNASDSEASSDSESDIERGASGRSRAKERLKKTKTKAKKKDRDRTRNRNKSKALSSRSSPFSSSTPSVVSPPLSFSPNRDIQQAILSLLLELPSHLEEVKKQRRSYPFPHPEPDEIEDETVTKTKPPRKRHR